MNSFVRSHSDDFSFRQFMRTVLAEDLGGGDHTSLSTIPAKHRVRMKLLAKADGIIAGVEAAQMILREIDRTSKVSVEIPDGKKVFRGDVVMFVEGNSRKLLLAERLLLNVMQRMSGIATKTSSLQALCYGTRAKVTDTRKTTPGFRFFEKWAVSIGGGVNHRFGLYDMVLIKDNHIDIAGGIGPAIRSAHDYLRKKRLRIPIEVETRSLPELREALRYPVDRVMLDNYSIADTRKAVKLAGGKVEIESSGGISEKNIGAYAKCGVDVISVGALTHNVKSLDLSLKVC